MFPMTTTTQIAPQAEKPKPKAKPKTTKAQRKRWQTAAKAKRKRLRLQLNTDDDAILTFGEWIALNGLSERTGRRILDKPGGPVVTKLTDKKIGISRRANRAWQEARSSDGGK
jgi:hypothetical protein